MFDERSPQDRSWSAANCGERIAGRLRDCERSNHRLDRGKHGGDRGIATAGGRQCGGIGGECRESRCKAIFESDAPFTLDELVGEEHDMALVEWLARLEGQLRVGGDDGGGVGKAECGNAPGAGGCVVRLALGNVVQQRAGPDEIDVDRGTSHNQPDGEFIGQPGDGPTMAARRISCLRPY